MSKPTHCKYNHEYTENNTIWYRGYRVCRTCRNLNAIKFRGKYKERVRAWHKQNYEKNSTKIIEYKKRYRAEGRHKTAQYKLSKPFYEMLKDQTNECAACHRPKEDGETFFVDHDHSCCPTNNDVCGKCVRGLVCRNCNTALGFVKDSKEHLQQLIDYLERYEKRIL